MTTTERRRLRASLEERVRELAAAYRRAHAPLTPDRLVGGIGYRWRAAALVGRDGLLERRSRTVVVAADQAAVRRRFTLAHEVMHHLIEQDGELLSDLHEAYEGAALERALERLCNLGAAEMLLPESAVRRALAEAGPNPRLIWELAGRYGVSEAVAGIALAGALGPRALAAVWGGRPLVLYHGHGPGAPERGSVLPEDHPLAQVRASGLPHRGPLRLPSGAYVPSAWARARAGRVYLLAPQVEGGGG